MLALQRWTEYFMAGHDSDPARTLEEVFNMRTLVLGIFFHGKCLPLYYSVV